MPEAAAATAAATAAAAAVAAAAAPDRLAYRCGHKQGNTL